MLRYLLVAAVLIGVTPCALGCSCGPSAAAPACSLIASADVVFLGTPTSAIENAAGQTILYRFAAQQVFKGLPQATQDVWINPERGSCTAEYRIGRQYLVFAENSLPESRDFVVGYVLSDGKRPLPPNFDPKRSSIYEADICSGTRPAEHAVDEVTYLRVWLAGGGETRVFGQVSESYAGSSPRPISGATVTLRGNSRVDLMTTDAKGSFAFDRVNLGRYSVIASLDKYDSAAKEIEVALRGCEYVELGLAANARIAGIVLDSAGRPASKISVQIARKHLNDDLEHFYSGTNETAGDGSFSFRGLPAGEFVVGVNIHTAPWPDEPYARTYAPGVPDMGAAEVVNVGPGEVRQGLNIQLPPRLKPREIRVTVHMPDGSSTGKGVGVSAEWDENTAADGTTDQNGVAVLKCLTGLDYKITAWKWLDTSEEIPWRDRRRIDAKPIFVGAGDPSVSIQTVLTDVTRIGDGLKE